MSERLVVPANIAIVPLPAKCPELNPQEESVWQFIRDNWLSNRVFANYDATVDHCCHTRNKLVAQPWKRSCPSVTGHGRTVLINGHWY